MKLTIYIVDDEPMAIQNLKMLLEGTTLDLEVIGTASNGVKAIPEITKLNPDFVFVDICMPVMDGLEMSEQILKNNPSQKIFMLTAYRDFEYAKKSISIGVADYILKNDLSEAGLEELITRNVAELDLDKRKRHSILETNLRNFFLSDVSLGIGGDWFYPDKPLQRYILFYVVKKPEIQLGRSERRIGGVLDCYRLEKEFEQQDIVCRAFFEMFRNEYCGIFFAQQNTSDLEFRCKEIAEKMMHIIDKKIPGLICLVSSTVNQFAQLQTMYNRLRGKVEYLYTGKEKVYMARELSFVEEKEQSREWEKNRTLWETQLREGREEEAESLLRNVLQSMESTLGIWEYTSEIQGMLRVLSELIRDKKLDPNLLQLAPVYSDTEKLIQDVAECQNQYLSKLRMRIENQYSRQIILAQEYIWKNYRQDISVADIAEAAGVSEGHLRRCFKKEMNENVINYLTDFRIQQAKKRMENGRESLDIIWNETGFTSAQYFSYVFKKTEGITPREYMRLVNEGGKRK